MHRQGAVGLGALGLPGDSAACLFDLDGVLTQTAAVHRAALKQTFDPILVRLGQEPFTLGDYLQYVDGKRRLDGVRTFLTARGIEVPEGGVDDLPEADTVGGSTAARTLSCCASSRSTGSTPTPAPRRLASRR